MATITDERRPLEDLLQHGRNYNVHSPDQVAKMANRMRHNAFTAPILIRPDGTILGGHLRRMALLHLKAENYQPPEGVGPDWTVPCRVFAGNEAQELALLAGDNQHPSEVTFDDQALASLLADLQQQGGMEGAGYSDEALDRLIGELAGPTEPDAPEEFPSYDEDIETEHECPKCGYRFSGGKPVPIEPDAAG